MELSPALRSAIILKLGLIQEQLIIKRRATDEAATIIAQLILRTDHLQTLVAEVQSLVNRAPVQEASRN